MTKLRKSEKNINNELILKGRDAYNDFDNREEVAVPPPQNKLISIRMPISMLRQLRTIAVAKGDIGYQHLIKTYIATGISADHEALLQSPLISYDVSSSSELVLLDIT